MVQRKQKPATPVTKHASPGGRMLQYARQHGLFTGKQSLLVGVSGGADSMVLLHLLHQAGFKVVAAHVNYALRGAESNAEEALVKRWCKKQNIPLQVLKPDLKQFARGHKMGTQEAARLIRYRWFENLRQLQQLDGIAVAHHATDQAETVLLNLLRGAGIKGLRGMLPINGQIIRPLLVHSKTEILEYARMNKIPYRNDSSNFTDTYKRNKIRNRILPLFEQINSAAVQHLSETAVAAAQAQAWMESETNKWQQQNITIQNDAWHIPIAALLAHAAPAALLHMLLAPSGFAPDVIVQVYEALNEEPGKIFESATHRLLLDRKHLLLAEKKQETGWEQYIIHKNDSELNTALFKLKLKKLNKTTKLKQGPHIGLFNASALKFPLTVRRWQKGDRFKPLGMKGWKKLSDFFTDNKLSLFQKEQVWVLQSGQDIAWVMGYRIDDRFKITDPARPSFKLEFMPLHD